MYFLNYRGYKNTLNYGRIAYHGMAVLVIIASVFLWYFILTHQYQYNYVYSYSNNDLRNLGFKTFDKLIDESFDDETDLRIRLEKIIQVVKDLCKQDLQQFIRAAGEICLYNQHLFIEYTQNTYKEFPKKLIEFINKS